MNQLNYYFIRCSIGRSEFCSISIVVSAISVVCMYFCKNNLIVRWQHIYLLLQHFLFLFFRNSYGNKAFVSEQSMTLNGTATGRPIPSCRIFRQLVVENLCILFRDVNRTGLKLYYSMRQQAGEKFWSCRKVLFWTTS